MELKEELMGILGDPGTVPTPPTPLPTLLPTLLPLPTLPTTLPSDPGDWAGAPVLLPPPLLPLPLLPPPD